MKPIFLEKDTKVGENSFYTRYAEVPHTYNQFHFHKEYELLYNIENSGTRFIGDSIRRFSNHDLVLVGPKIPHYWHSDDQYFMGDPTIKARVVLVQFVANFLGDEFLKAPEMALIRNLLDRAIQGIQIRGDEARTIGEKLYQVTQLSGWKKVMVLIEALCLMSEAKDFILLASRGFCESHKVGNEERISSIFNHIIKNHHRDYKLEEAAELANMNPSAFCRYIKKTTSKTYSEILNEIRIGFACKMLINTEDSISQVAYTCGYQNVPYFNRQFRSIKDKTPMEYRMNYKVR
ncbi:MAG: helix-turn-helix transcriptional regulator [Mariniphaga sp.]|nr:helix-turn-helix transcriptional regulator [Mariniphaga sp.]